MKVYLSSSFDRRIELCEYRRQLESLGYEVVSSWLDESPLIYEDPAISSPILSMTDVNDLASCEILINFTERPERGYTTGGRHVEYGMAYAWDKVLCLVGPPENVFHFLPETAQFDHWDTCRDWLRLVKEDEDANRVLEAIE